MAQQAGAVTPRIVREHIVYASVARIASPTAVEFNNPSGTGLLVRINCTAITASPSVVFTIQGYDPAAGGWYDILASAAIVGAGATILRVHPELTAAANTIAKDIVPANWRVSAVHADADSITYSVGAIVSA